jgi:class 3 adenylate cyclase/tetratricopeptide (TPR) repeat protein
MTTTCDGCGHENGQGRRFCGQCGAPLGGLTCASCGRENEPGERFCGECGLPLVPAPPAAARPRVDPQTPHQLAEKILDARPRLEGERKQVTILFADVKGSMELQEDLDPEEWARMMDRFFQILSEGVHRFEGTVDKFTGDGIMALFGAPVAHEDHARRACHAALHLTGAIADYAGELRQTQGLSFHVRVGLNSGEVVVGRIGDDARMEYTALGHTVGLAQRMEALAQPGMAYLTESTARLVAGSFRLRDLGRVPVKGSREPVGVFVLEGTSRRRGLSRWPGRSPLVGRDEEMASLEAALGRALDGQAQVVGVVGEAGVGKSRLCEEFARACLARGVPVRRTAGLSHARGIPFLPILELLRDFYGITDADSPHQAREKVAGRMVMLDPALQEALPLLFDFLEVPDPDRPPPRLSAEARMRAIFEILRGVVQRRSEREAVVNLFEDLHWFDPESEAFLTELIPSYPGTRTLVVANFRPEFSAPWMRHSYYRQLPLQPLSPAAVEELLGALVGADPSLAPLPRYLIERTGGNPFFVEEVIRALVEVGTLAGDPGSYRLTRPLEDVRVPPTVEAVLAARIDRLPERDKQVVQTAAVIGRTFPESVLQAVAGQSEEDLGSALRALCAAEFLQEEPVIAVPEYRFWHPLTQEVAYGSLLSERRARLHAGVARALADLDPARQDERAALVASHFEAAGDDLEAARWQFRSANWARRRDLTEAIRRWRATLAHLDRVPEDDDALALGVRTRARLLQVGARRGIDADETQTLFEEGRVLAERLGDSGLLAGLTQFYAAALYMRGDVGDAMDSYREAARLADETMDPEVRTGTALGLTIGVGYTGPLEDGLRLTNDLLVVCAGDPERGQRYLGYSPMVRLFLSRADLLSRMGRLDAGREDAERALVMARERSEIEVVSWTLAVSTRLAYDAGDEEDLRPLAAEAARISADSGNLALHVIALQALGMAELAAGRWEEATATLSSALSEADQYRVGLCEAGSLLAYLALGQLAVGDEAAAICHAHDAVATARRQGARVLECLGLLTRARILRQTKGDDNAARDDLSAALALVHETGARTYVPFISEERGRLEGSDDELQEALRGFGDIGARGRVARLEAELAGAST